MINDTAVCSTQKQAGERLKTSHIQQKERELEQGIDVYGRTDNDTL